MEYTRTRGESRIRLTESRALRRREGARVSQDAGSDRVSRDAGSDRAGSECWLRLLPYATGLSLENLCAVDLLPMWG